MTLMGCLILENLYKLSRGDRFAITESCMDTDVLNNVFSVLSFNATFRDEHHSLVCAI